MAHRKNPYAQRRRAKLSNPIFCMYTRKDYTIKSWTNRLKGLNRSKQFAFWLRQKAKAKCKLKVKHSPNKNTANNKKVLQKQTHAVMYSSHFSNSIYPLYSKAIFFKNSKINKKKQSKLYRL